MKTFEIRMRDGRRFFVNGYDLISALGSDARTASDPWNVVRVAEVGYWNIE